MKAVKSKRRVVGKIVLPLSWNEIEIATSVSASVQPRLLVLLG